MSFVDVLELAAKATAVGTGAAAHIMAPTGIAALFTSAPLIVTAAPAIVTAAGATVVGIKAYNIYSKRKKK